MRNENKFLKILVIILTIINLFICLKSMRLELEYNKLNRQNEYNNKDEQIKQLEQSLNEQIQEKEVYMKMLESEEK